MKEAVAGDQEVALELEEHLGMVELGIRLENGLGGLVWSGMFFFITICTLGFMRIVVVDEQHLIPRSPFVPSAAPSLKALTAVAVPSISPLTRFMNLSLRSPPSCRLCPITLEYNDTPLLFVVGWSRHREMGGLLPSRDRGASNINDVPSDVPSHELLLWSCRVGYTNVIWSCDTRWWRWIFMSPPLGLYR